MGLLHEGQGDRTAASAELLAGLAAADLRRSTISNDELRTAVSGQVVVADLVRTASRVALDDGRAAEAAELAMRGQARALVDLVSGAAARRRTCSGVVGAAVVAAVRRSTPRWRDWRGAHATLETASRRLLFAIAAATGAETLQRLRAERDAAQQAVRSAEESLATSTPTTGAR